MLSPAKAPVNRAVRGAVHRHGHLTRQGLLERTFTVAFRGLVYARIWEDPAVDLEALAITPDCHVVTIASGGCNLLSYLTADPAAISAVDLNTAHVALNRLKLAAALAPGGEVRLVDFGQQERLPAAFRTALFAWLARFDVTPRAELERSLARAASDLRGSCRFIPLHRGYAWSAVLRRPWIAANSWYHHAMNKVTPISAGTPFATRFTVGDFQSMMDAGAFADMRVELVAGMLEKMMPSHFAHGEANVRLAAMLPEAFAGSSVRIGSDLVLRIDEFTVRAPDIAVCDPTTPDDQIPDSGYALRAVKIADTSLSRDLGSKVEEYARGGIASYWVVDLDGRVVHCLSQPVEGIYTRRTVYRFGESVPVPGTDRSIIID